MFHFTAMIIYIHSLESTFKFQLNHLISCVLSLVLIHLLWYKTVLLVVSYTIDTLISPDHSLSCCCALECVTMNYPRPWSIPFRSAYIDTPRGRHSLEIHWKDLQGNLQSGVMNGEHMSSNLYSRLVSVLQWIGTDWLHEHDSGFCSSLNVKTISFKSPASPPMLRKQSEHTSYNCYHISVQIIYSYDNMLHIARSWCTSVNLC